MSTQSNVSDLYYETITGGRIPISRLREEEYRTLEVITNKYSERQDWTRFAAWWNAKFNGSGLATGSVVYRICQDLEARLGINQKKVSPPDYRDYLAELIESRFGSRQEFCRATGIDPGQLSRVLAGRDNLSMKVLLQVMEVLHTRLVIQNEEDFDAHMSIVQAIEEIQAALNLYREKSESRINFAQPIPCPDQIDAKDEDTELSDWKISFPNVANLEAVRDRASTIANKEMPLMFANVA